MRARNFSYFSFRNLELNLNFAVLWGSTNVYTNWCIDIPLWNYKNNRLLGRFVTIFFFNCENFLICIHCTTKTKQKQNKNFANFIKKFRKYSKFSKFFKNPILLEANFWNNFKTANSTLLTLATLKLIYFFNFKVMRKNYYKATDFKFIYLISTLKMMYYMCYKLQVSICQK